LARHCSGFSLDCAAFRVIPEAKSCISWFDRACRERTTEGDAMKAAKGVRTVCVIALVCAIAGLAALPAATSRHAARPRAGKVIAKVPIPAGSGSFAIGEGAVWAVGKQASTLSRIDPARNAVVARIKLKAHNPCPEFPRSCGEAAAGNGAVWVSRPSDNTVSRIDPRTNTVTATIRVGSQPTAIAVSPGAVWVANTGDPSVSRIDPATNRVVATIRVGPARVCCSDHMEVTWGSSAVWATVTNLGAVVRVDPKRNSVSATIRLSSRRSGQPCGFLAAEQGAVWAAGAHCPASSGYGVVTRIDPRTNRPTSVVRGFKAPIGLALGFRFLWVGDLDAKSIDRVNPRTGRIVGRLSLAGIPLQVETGFGSVWVGDGSGRVLRIRPQRWVLRLVRHATVAPRVRFVRGLRSRRGTAGSRCHLSCHSGRSFRLLAPTNRHVSPDLQGLFCRGRDSNPHAPRGDT
jgi:virginiamycin B lyase